MKKFITFTLVVLLCMGLFPLSIVASWITDPPDLYTPWALSIPDDGIPFTVGANVKARDNEYNAYNAKIARSIEELLGICDHGHYAVVGGSCWEQYYPKYIMDKSFFDENAVIILFVTNPSYMYSNQIDSVVKKNGKLTVNMTTICPQSAYWAVGYKRIAIEVKKADIEDVSSVSINNTNRYLEDGEIPFGVGFNTMGGNWNSNPNTEIAGSTNELQSVMTQYNLWDYRDIYPNRSDLILMKYTDDFFKDNATIFLFISYPNGVTDNQFESLVKKNGTLSINMVSLLNATEIAPSLCMILEVKKADIADVTNIVVNNKNKYDWETDPQTTHTVTFKNGDTILDTQTVEDGKAAIAPAAPYTPGYTVTLNLDGGSFINPPPIDSVLYTFEGWDKSFNRITGDLTVNTLWSYVIMYTPTRKGYHFEGWDTGDAWWPVPPRYLTGHITLYAKWSTEDPSTTYTITVNGSGMADPTAAVAGETVSITWCPPPIVGIHFDKWTTTDSIIFANERNSTTTFIMPAKNVTVTPISYYSKITVIGGSANRTDSHRGATITITADNAPPGKVFDRWTSADDVVFAKANAAKTTFRMPANNVTITANYKNKLKIKTQPKGKTVQFKKTVTLKITATGGAGNLKYQWYSSKKNRTTGGNKIAKATKINYKAPANKKGTRYYYCIVTDENNNMVKTRVAKVTVK